MSREFIGDGGPAFPIPGAVKHYDEGSFSDADHAGMTLRQYAAITLRVPDSGDDWLDEMIRKRLRDDLAIAAMPQGFFTGGLRDRARAAYVEADAILAAREAP